MADVVEVCWAVVFVLVAGFGGVVRCEIGGLPVDLVGEASLDVDFDGEADFCKIFTNVEYFTLTGIITNQSGNETLSLE